MKGYCASLLTMTLLMCSHAAASITTLPPLGTSAPLRSLALTPRALATQVAREADAPLRIVVPRASGMPRAGIEADQPQYTLPAGGGAPALPPVRTDSGSVNIEGLRAGGGGGGGGALGDLQYVQLADGLMAVYRKADGALLLGPVLANAMYVDAPAGRAADACASPSASATSVHFDQLARRWIVAHSAAAHGLHYQCLAVSENSDATGSYHRYALQMQALYFDDPQLAVWPNAYYFSVNLFDSPEGSYRGPRICGVERQALLRGGAAVMYCRDLGATRAPVTPASLEGDAGALQGRAPALFLALESGRLLLWRFSVAADRLDDPVAVPVAPFGAACPTGAACVKQPAPGGLLAATGDRLMPRPVFRSGDEYATLLATHSVTMPDGQLGVRWYEIRDPLGAARVYQQGSFSPDGASRWMGSIGMDKAGNIALGYAVAAADTPPGIRYSGRQRTDPPGRLQAEQVIFNGHGVQPGQARLARASGALALDPIDGCTFWYTQRYLPSTGTANWRTRIASFKFEACR